MKSSSFLPLLLCLALPGCALLGITTKVKVAHELVSLDNGAHYREVLVGEGPAVTTGQTITIDYVGFLADGSIFDSSIQRGVPIDLTLGMAPLAGWNTGILGMRVGGQRNLCLPPELAYGEAGIEGLIPPNETLVFEISLLSIAE
ncbi:MAG: peptidylprolyl isomerase [Candidatus Paceibacteria bacterium]|jgi:peptidylprolyl isomerase